MATELILVVQQHPQFGWKLNLYSANRSGEEGWTIAGLPVISEAELRGASPDEIELIKTVSEISDDKLMKAYTREKDKTKVASHVIDNLIRPRIEKNCEKILALANKINIPLFFREKTTEKHFYSFNQIERLPEASKCVFNFIKGEKGIRYFITLLNDGQPYQLQRAPAIALCSDPCIILLGREIHRVVDIDANKLLPFFTKTHIEVPLSSEKAYIQKFVIKTIPKYDVRIEGIEMKEKQPQKQAVLVLEEDIYQQMTLRLYLQYDKQRLVPKVKGTPKVVGVEGAGGSEQIVWFDRDFEWEQEQLAYLLELGLYQKGENHFYLKYKDEDAGARKGLISWINTHSEQLSRFQLIQNTAHPYYQGKMELRSRIDTKIDWFDLNMEVVFDSITIPFIRFKKHILTGNPEFILPDGSIFILPEEWFEKYYEVTLHGEPTESAIRIKKFHAPLLDSVFNQGEQYQLKPNKEQLPAVPPGLKATLRPYQQEGFAWLNYLRKQHFGACLADDMGLGKTLQTIALLEYVYSSTGNEYSNPALPTESKDGQLSLFDEPAGSLPASLIVVPKSLIHNWRNELRRFVPGMKVYIHAGINRLKSNELGKIFKHYQVVISSYSIVRNDIDYFKKYPFLYLILDESQYIKNPESIIYQAVNSLQAEHKVVLTGTPIENSLSDLWAQFNFINPRLLGDYSFFKENYLQKIEKEKDQHTESTLLKLINPFILRRTKEEVAPDLPPLSEEIVYCDMTDDQEEVYAAEMNRIRNRLLENKEQFLKDRFMALKSLMSLRLLANHPRLSNKDYEGSAGKFDQILLYFDTIQAAGHKVLIFSSFVTHLQLLAKAFEEKAWKYAMLTGQTQDREAAIKQFNSKDVNCFFISLKAGGTGLNLTSADYVFIIDPWWNPAAENQAVSRAHRIGQEKNVFVYRFISTDSIEEKIIRLQEGKKHLADSLINASNPLSLFDNSEIENIFS